MSPSTSVVSIVTLYKLSSVASCVKLAVVVKAGASLVGCTVTVVPVLCVPQCIG